LRHFIRSLEKVPGSISRVTSAKEDIPKCSSRVDRIFSMPIKLLFLRVGLLFYNVYFEIMY
jgi:hypothetical protein